MKRWEILCKFILKFQADATAYKTQHSRVDKLYRRQLGVPLLNAEDTASEYLTFIGKNEMPADLTSTIQKAKEAMKDWIKFEDILDDASKTEEHLQV